MMNGHENCSKDLWYVLIVPLASAPTYRPVGEGVLGPCPRHCTLTVNPSDRNSTGRSLVGTSWGGEGLGDKGVSGVPCHMAGGIPGHLQHTPPSDGTQTILTYFVFHFMVLVLCLYSLWPQLRITSSYLYSPRIRWGSGRT